MTMASERIEIAVDPADRTGVTWSAIIGGALVAAAVSLILMVLGSGLGLSVISPWSSLGANAATIAVGSVIWLVIVQWIASGLGGYLTGRMRARAAEPSDEVFFRDTANGFLAWALSTLLVAALLTSALSAIVGTGAAILGSGAQVAGTVGAGAAQGAMQGSGGIAGASEAYFVDTLFRPNGASGSASTAAGAAADSSATAAGAASGGAAATGTATGASTAPASTDTTAAPATAGTEATPAPAATEATTTPAVTAAPAATATAPMAMANPMGTPGSAADDAALRAETGRILINGLTSTEFPAGDVDYLANRIAAATGIPADAAKTRVTDVIQKLQQAKADAQTAADQARKSASRLGLYMFLALLVGAFIASAAAALGGGHRDERPAMMVR